MYQLFSWHLPSRENSAALILSALVASARIGSMSIVEQPSLQNQEVWLDELALPIGLAGQGGSRVAASITP